MFLTGTLALGAAHSHALNIMLVNDDGCNAPGLVTLAGVLEQRGHNVSVYAPAGEQSGQGSPPALDNIRRTYCVSDHSDLSEAWIPIALAAAFISEYVLPRMLATDAIPHPVVSSCTTGLSTDSPLMHNE